jgi:MFS family permease
MKQNNAIGADDPPVKRLPGPRNRLLFAGAFVFCFTTTMLSFALIYLLKDRFTFDSGQIGSSMALGSAVYFSSCFLYQRVGSRWKPQLVLPLAVFGCLVFSLLLGLTSTGAVAVTAWCAIQLSTGFFWPPIQAWFTRGLSEAELNRDIGWFNRSWMSGSLLAPLAGGFLYHYDWFLSMAVALACFLGALGLFIFLALPGRKESAEALSLQPDRTRGKSGGAAFLEKSLAAFKIRGWLGAICANVFSGVLANIVPLYIRDTLGYTEKTAGLVLLFRGLAAIAAFGFYSRFIFWHFNQKWLLILHGILVFFSLLFLLAGRMVFLYLFIAAGFGFVYAGCYNNSIFYSGADKKNTTKNMAFHEIFLSTGGAIGSLGGGFCFQCFGMGGTFLALALVQSVGLGTLILLNSRQSIRMGK